MPKYHFYKQHDRSDCGATCLRMVFPFLTQAMIDRGIEGKNLHIISLLLLAQLMLSLGQLGNDLLRG